MKDLLPFFLITFPLLGEDIRFFSCPPSPSSLPSRPSPRNGIEWWIHNALKLKHETHSFSCRWWWMNQNKFDFMIYIFRKNIDVYETFCAELDFALVCCNIFLGCRFASSDDGFRFSSSFHTSTCLFFSFSTFSFFALDKKLCPAVRFGCPFHSKWKIIFSVFWWNFRRFYRKLNKILATCHLKCVHVHHGIWGTSQLGFRLSMWYGHSRRCHEKSHAILIFYLRLLPLLVGLCVCVTFLLLTVCPFAQ